MGKLDLLPFGEMPWEEFERIQWRILRDVEGLRLAQIYGERGQSQFGLDVVALVPDGSGVALQRTRRLLRSRDEAAMCGCTVARSGVNWRAHASG